MNWNENYGPANFDGILVPYVKEIHIYLSFQKAALKSHIWYIATILFFYNVLLCHVFLLFFFGGANIMNDWANSIETCSSEQAT